MSFNIGELYSAREMSGGELHGLFDGFYAVVDGKLEALSMWEDDIVEDAIKEEGLTEKEAYSQARDDILSHLRMVYEDAKNIAAFVGVPPVGPGKAFDFYSTFKCVEVL